MPTRIIPRLDIKGPNLVKGIHLEGLRVLGKPEWFARYYYETGADELFYMDAVASLYGRNSLLDIVKRTAREVFVPLTVGGGLRTLDDIKSALRAGADKVALNTAVIQRPELITEASRKFGASTILVSIEAIKMPDGTYEAFTHYGREATGINAFEWAIRAVELGAGELMVTSIDRDGTGRGFDLELTQSISESVPVPVIAGGGAGTIDHVHDVISDGHADAVSVASLLHYGCLDKFEYDDDAYSGEGNTEFLKGPVRSSRIPGVTLPELKENLMGRGIECREVTGSASHL